MGENRPVKFQRRLLSCLNFSLPRDFLFSQRLQRRRIGHPGQDFDGHEDVLRERARRAAPPRILGPALLAGERRPGEV